MSSQYNITIDLYNDWSEIIKNELNKLGFSIDDNEESDEIIMKYFNLSLKQISEKPRKILVSDEFYCPSEYEEGLEKIKNKIKNGKNLIPHLSKRISDLDYDDAMLNDWGIYHLHLGTEIQDSGFVERTGPLLFARFDSNYAYFINVFSHGNWTNQKIIEIIHNNWEESIAKYRLKGVKSVSPSYSDEDLKKLRRAGVVAMVEVEPGVVYAPLGGGYMTNGISTNVVMTHDKYARMLRDYENYVRDNINSFVAKVNELKDEVKTDFKFVLQIKNEKFLVLEKNNQIIWDIKLNEIKLND